MSKNESRHYRKALPFTLWGVRPPYWDLAEVHGEVTAYRDDDFPTLRWYLCDGVAFAWQSQCGPQLSMRFGILQQGLTYKMGRRNG
jgi:hypothetical protein